jgi:hypothetical protein
MVPGWHMEHFNVFNNLAVFKVSTRLARWHKKRNNVARFSVDKPIYTLCSYFDADFSVFKLV